jgi:hypothetical protein
MPELIALHVKGRNDVIAARSKTPLVYVVTNDLHLTAPERKASRGGIHHAIQRAARLLCTEKAR